MYSFQLYVCALHYRMLGYYGVRLTVEVWNMNLSAIQATFEIVVTVLNNIGRMGVLLCC